MKLILHIGTEKTGTTSIQKFLLKNREALNKQNILYPKSTCGLLGNHRWVPTFAYNEKFEDDFIIKNFNCNSTLRKDSLDKKLDEFKKEISNSNANICLLSSEHFSSRLVNIQEIYKLKSILEDFFDEISIILYIRKPINYAISLLSTELISGGTPLGLDLESFKKRSNLNLIQKWEEVFSIKNIKIKLFEKNDFLEGDLLKDFSKECGIQISSEFKTGFKTNQTLNLLQMKCLRYLNQFFPRFKNKKSNPERDNLVDFIYNNFESSDYFKPTQKEYNLFSQEFAKEDEIIRNRFFPDKEKLWQSYKKGYEIKENSLTDLSKKDIMYLTAIRKLWIKSK